MNICFVNDSFKGYGGVNRVVTTVANSLQKMGHEVSLIDFYGENEIGFEVDLNIKRPNPINKPTYKRLFNKVLLYLKYEVTGSSLNVYDLYKEQTKDLITHFEEENYDIVVLCQGLLTALLPQIKHKIKTTKFIAWQHSEFETYTNKYYKRYINDYISGIKEADQVICLTKKDKVKFSEINENTVSIYNPLTIPNDHDNISKLQNKSIVFIGSLEIKKKGLDYLIEIGKKIEPGWKIYVAGNGPDKNKFIKFIKKNHLENVIILKGSLNDNELTDLYLSSSIFISTSRWEGFGLVLTEAMSFGLPIISFDNNGPSEILQNGEYGILIENGNIEDFTEKLNQLINNYTLRKKYQQKSLIRAEEFRLKNIIKEWEKLFK